MVGEDDKTVALPVDFVNALVETYTLEARCEIVADNAAGRCPDATVALRWEDGFIDEVCEHHASAAAHRGAFVMWRPDRTTAGGPS